MEPSWLLCSRAESPVVPEALGRIATNGPLQLDFQRVDVLRVLQENSSSRHVCRFHITSPPPTTSAG